MYAPLDLRLVIIVHTILEHVFLSLLLAQFY